MRHAWQHVIRIARCQLVRFSAQVQTQTARRHVPRLFVRMSVRWQVNTGLNAKLNQHQRWTMHKCSPGEPGKHFDGFSTLSL